MTSLFAYCIGTLIMHLAIFLVSLDVTRGEEIWGLQWINPVIIYRNVKVNWFGCIILTIIAHIVAGPWCLLYWFYKLCTIGREEE